MASLLFQSLLSDLAGGLIDFATGTFLAVPVAGYVPDANAHTSLGDVTGAVATAVAVAVTVTRDDPDAAVDVTFDAVTWLAAAFTWRGVVIYQDVGLGADNPLVCYVDNGVDTTVAGGDAEQSFTTPLRITRN